jgi:hypothetical protein
MAEWNLDRASIVLHVLHATQVVARGNFTASVR